MRLIRLANLLASRYKVAGDSSEPAFLRYELRQQADMLWMYFTGEKLYNILLICAENAPKGRGGSVDQKKALAGHLFCKELFEMVNYLHDNKDLSLGEVREVLLNIVKLIEKNKNFGGSEEAVASQFGHVIEFIFQILPHGTKRDRTMRDQQYAKARTGLSRILSVSIEMLKKIQALEVMVPEEFTHQPTTEVDINRELPKRFIPSRAPLSVYDTVDFIRQHGDEYGIPSQEDWATVFMDDPALKEEMTTVINALNRGHSPHNARSVKLQIADIMRRYKERKSNNAELFEDAE